MQHGHSCNIDTHTRVWRDMLKNRRWKERERERKCGNGCVSGCVHVWVSGCVRVGVCACASNTQETLFEDICHGCKCFVARWDIFQVFFAHFNFDPKIGSWRTNGVASQIILMSICYTNIIKNLFYTLVWFSLLVMSPRSRLEKLSSRWQVCHAPGFW